MAVKSDTVGVQEHSRAPSAARGEGRS
jgi:hypothetical protein